MTNLQIGLSAVGILLILLLMRVPIGVALIGVSFGGLTILAGFATASALIISVPYTFSAHWTLSSVPMFLLMGYVCYYAGLTDGLFAAARAWLGRLPGSLALASVAGSSAFASVSGSSIANAAAMGRIAIPEMLRRRYDPALAAGSVAAAGTIGALIPPSVILIVYAIFAKVSVTELFAASLVVGLLTAILYSAAIILIAKLRPALAPLSDEVFSLREKMALMWDLWPILAVAVSVLVGMFSGFLSATEAGAFGAAMSMLIALLKGTLTRDVLQNSLSETMIATGSIFIIAIGASLLSRFLALSGVAQFFQDALMAAGENRVLLMLIVTLIYLALGMFLEPMGAMLLTLPIMLPVFAGGDYNLLWFGLVLVKYLEMGMLTPPVGLNVFVIKGVVGDTIATSTIFRGVLIFLMVDMIIIFLLFSFPKAFLLLPQLLFG